MRIAGPHPGAVDAIKTLPSRKLIALEWETGNISSSHRAMNKIVLGMLTGVLVGGVLIFPSRNFYRYLTDRIGNYQELEPYFPVWQSVGLRSGFLRVIEIEYDATSPDVQKIPKGTDGWSQFQAS